MHVLRIIFFFFAHPPLVRVAICCEDWAVHKLACYWADVLPRRLRLLLAVCFFHSSLGSLLAKMEKEEEEGEGKNQMMVGASGCCSASAFANVAWRAVARWRGAQPI